MLFVHSAFNFSKPEFHIAVLLSEHGARGVAEPVREGEMSRPGSDMPNIPMSP